MRANNRNAAECLFCGANTFDLDLKCCELCGHNDEDVTCDECGRQIWRGKSREIETIEGIGDDKHEIYKTMVLCQRCYDSLFIDILAQEEIDRQRGK